MGQAKIIITDDGSHTLKVEELSEHYHSTFGAVSESKHVFIEAGLHKVLEAKRNNISILEVGFGTALNALLTVLEMDAQSPSIHYYGIEAYPLEENLWRKLNYPDILSGEGEVGKRLNFLLQEMNREINTIGSKANETNISRIVVDLKEATERIREQALNLV